MATSVRPQRRVPRPAEVRPEVHGKVLERLRARDRARGDRWRTLRRELDRLQSQHHDERLRLFGRDGLERWRRDPRSRDPETAGLVLQELGVDPSALQALTRGLRDRVRELIPDLSLPGVLDQWEEVGPPPLPTVVRPPFAGLHTGDFVDAWSLGGPHDLFAIEPRFSAEPIHSANVTSGRTEATVGTSNPRAGDRDWIYAVSWAYLGFFYRTPRSGRLRVTISARAVDVAHSVTFTGEFGFSIGWVSHLNVLELKCTGPDADFGAGAEMSRFDKTFEADGSLSAQPLAPDSQRVVTLSTGGSFPADTDVWVEVGTSSFQMNHANDVSMSSRVSGVWSIDSVTLGSVS